MPATVVVSMPVSVPVIVVVSMPVPMIVTCWCPCSCCELGAAAQRSQFTQPESPLS
ncbi:MAG: hypothetical protein U1F11_15070 [Steroidobacteraceae bacterium]